MACADVDAAGSTYFVFVVCTVGYITADIRFLAGTAVCAGGVLHFGNFIRKAVAKGFAAFVRFAVLVNFNVLS